MKTLVARFIVGSCLVAAVAACAGAQITPPADEPAPAPSRTAQVETLATPEQMLAPIAKATAAAEAYLQRAVMVVAAEMNLAPAAVTVDGFRAVDWPDAGLGCPLPGMAYLQKVTPGYLVTLSSAGVVYAVHMDVAGMAIVCSTDGTPLPGSMPILPGDRLLDGKPWMPVN